MLNHSLLGPRAIGLLRVVSIAAFAACGGKTSDTEQNSVGGTAAAPTGGAIAVLNTGGNQAVGGAPTIATGGGPTLATGGATTNTTGGITAVIHAGGAIGSGGLNGTGCF